MRDEAWAPGRVGDECKWGSGTKIFGEGCGRER